MSSVSSARAKRPDPLSKKVPENPKFKHVRATVDTGASMTRYLQKVEEMKRDHRPRPKLFQEDRRTLRNILVDSVKDYKFRKDEIFKRMKVTTFVQLVIQVADIDPYDDGLYESNGGNSNEMGSSYRPDTADLEVMKIQEEGVEGGGAGGLGGGDGTSRTDTSRSRLSEVIRGVGEADLNDGSHPFRPLVNTSTCPYLLLDIREKDAYDACHIITAQSYPTAMLARSVNYESKDMLRCKNQEGKIIILYDYDETLAHRAATTLVQRGYDNLFMLSGGLKVAFKIFPEGLITGTVPASLMEEVGAGSKKKGGAQTPAPIKPATQVDFTRDNLDCLETLMDSALGDSSSGSRLSQYKGGSSSRMSTVSSTSRMMGFGKPPFKH